MNIQTFKQLHLKNDMLKVVEHLQFKQPTEIQEKAIPLILNGKSMIGQSQTGSGKTHAYLLPLLNNIKEEHQEVQIVITAPTRELSIQIFEEIKQISKYLGKENNWVSRLIIGGMDRPRMMKQLKRSAHIIVGTPGRILDMVNEGVLSIFSASSFVIDEADLMLDLNFIDTIDELLVKSRKDVQILVFSATIPLPLQHFFKKYLSNPTLIKIESNLSPETLEHRLIEKKHRNESNLIIQLSNIIQPYVALIFVNSKEFANDLASTLKQNGLNVGVLHGGLTSRERTRTVKAINNLQYQYIVATDLASRGIDIKGTSHVINAELPKEIEFYVHRVGRTARAGAEGMAINFFSEVDVKLIEQLERKGIKFIYGDLKGNEWVPSKRYDQRTERKHTVTNIDKEAWRRVKKRKEVKPGYKKKMKKEQEKIKRRMVKQKRSKR